MLPTALSEILRRDTAENSIMQTITIAVSAILIAAGLVTAPGLINNARDNNATTDLANMAYAQEFYLSSDGVYTERVTEDLADSEGWWLGKMGNIKYSLSGNVVNHAALICVAPDTAYLLKAESSSGKVFFRASGSGKTSTVISELTIDPCLMALPGWDDFVAGSGGGGAIPPVTTSQFSVYNAPVVGNAIAFGEGVFVTAHPVNGISTSTDGVNWTSVSSITGIGDIAYGNGSFAAFGVDPDTYEQEFYYSPDGVTWTQTTLAVPSGYNMHSYQVEGDSGNLVALLTGYTPSWSEFRTMIYTSSDGATWSLQENTVSADSVYPSFSATNNRFFITDQTVSGELRIRVSEDGMTSTSTLINSDGFTVSSIAYGGGKYLAVGAGDGRYYTSTNGIDWTEGVLANGSATWSNVDYAGGTFIVTESTAQWQLPRILTSSTGEPGSWTTHTEYGASESFNIINSAVGNNLYVGIRDELSLYSYQFNVLVFTP